MSDEMNVKISDIKAKFIRKEAEMVDKYFGNNDGKISKEEGAKLAQVLSGDLEKNQKKLAKESDEVKAIFGLNVSTPIAKTTATSVTVDKVNEAIGNAAKKTYSTPFEEVKARFLEVMGYNEETNTSNGTTTKEAYKAVKKEFKGKGKDYDKAIDQLKDYAKHDFVNMRAQKTRAAIQGFDSEGNISNASNLQYDTSKKVYKRAKELTTENNNGVKDKWAQRALRNRNTSFINKSLRYLSGNASAGKVDDRAVAAGNRAAIIRTFGSFTKEDLVKALGKDNPLLQEYTDKNGKTYENVLIATGLMTVENGEYKVKELSKVVGGAIGKDNTLNDHDNHNESEIQSVLTRIYQSLRANGSGDFKTSVLKDSQVRDLVEFLGYENDRDKLFAVRVWQNMWKGAGRGAVAGAAAGAINTRKTNLDVNVNQKVNLNLDGFTAEQKTDFINSIHLNNELADVPIMVNNGSGFAQSTLSQITETTVGILINQDVMVNVKLATVFKAIAMGTLTGAGAGAALGVLETLGSHAREREVLGMVFDCDSTYEEIIDTIDNAYSDKQLPPAMKEALKKVAELGIVKQRNHETGMMEAVLDDKYNTKWDYCQFIEAYNEARGNQILNAAEVRATARTEDKEKPVIPDCNQPEPEKEKEEKVVEDCPDCGLTKEEKPVEKEAFKYELKYGYGYWPNIIDAFYDLDCMKDDAKKAGYKSVTVYFKHEICRKPDGTYDEEMFKKLKAGYIPKFISLPEQIGDCKLDRNGKVEFHQPQGNPQGYVNGVTIKQKGNEVTLTDCKGRSGKGNSVDSALSNLNSQLPAGTDPYTESDIKK